MHVQSCCFADETLLLPHRRNTYGVVIRLCWKIACFYVQMGYLQFPIPETVSIRGMGASFWYNDFWERWGVQAFTYDWLMVALNIINQS